jgi:hypothetical protein
MASRRCQFILHNVSRSPPKPVSSWTFSKSRSYLPSRYISRLNAECRMSGEARRTRPPGTSTRTPRSLSSAVGLDTSCKCSAAAITTVAGVIGCSPALNRFADYRRAGVDSIGRVQDYLIDDSLLVDFVSDFPADPGKCFETASNVSSPLVLEQSLPPILF